MSFKPRMTKPENGNPYYNRIANGGYSKAIKGSPTDAGCDVLSNCVGYAYGRFNEICNLGYCKYLAPVNAENFMRYIGNCKTGMTPKLGACMVWQKGATLNSSDGVGHVAIVEKIVSDTEVVTSESDWNGKPFYTKTRKKGSNGRWGAGSSFKFLGFIYNPGVTDEPDHDEKQDKEDEDMTGEQIYNKLVEYLSSQKMPEWAKEDFEEAKKLGITDGSNPMLFTPRYQSAIMVKNGVTK